MGCMPFGLPPPDGLCCVAHPRCNQCILRRAPCLDRQEGQRLQEKTLTGFLKVGISEALRSRSWHRSVSATSSPMVTAESRPTLMSLRDCRGVDSVHYERCVHRSPRPNSAKDSKQSGPAPPAALHAKHWNRTPAPDHILKSPNFGTVQVHRSVFPDFAKLR